MFQLRDHLALGGILGNEVGRGGAIGFEVLSHGGWECHAAHSETIGERVLKAELYLGVEGVDEGKIAWFGISGEEQEAGRKDEKQTAHGVEPSFVRI